MRCTILGMVGVILAFAVAAPAARAQQQVVVETPGVNIVVPVVPELKGVVTRTAPPAELTSVQQGIVFIGRRGAYLLTGAGQEGQAIFRDGNNHGFSRGLTY